jgi:hypothetical protein
MTGAAGARRPAARTVFRVEQKPVLPRLALGEPHPALAQRGAAGGRVGADPRQLAAVARPIGWSSENGFHGRSCGGARRSTRANTSRPGQQQVQQEAGQLGQRPDFGGGFGHRQFHA